MKIQLRLLLRGVSCTFPSVRTACVDFTTQFLNLMCSLPFVMAALCNRGSLYSCPVVSSLFPHLISTVADWMSTIYFDTWCGPSANLECRFEMCCARLAGNAAPKKIAKKWPSGHHRTNLSGYIFATKSRINNRKNLLNVNISPTCHHNMVSFGPVAAEICWRVWGTFANFNGFLVLAALLHGTLVVGVSQTLRR